MRLIERFNLDPVVDRTGYENMGAAIALGGGGARGIAHLGAMQVIGDSGIQTEQIVGVSMGSLIGAMCAADSNMLSVQAKAIEFLSSPIFQHKQQALRAANTSTQSNAPGPSESWFARLRSVIAAHRAFVRVVSQPSLIDGAFLDEVVQCLVSDVDLRDLPTPLAIVAALDCNKSGFVAAAVEN